MFCCSIGLRRSVRASGTMTVFAERATGKRAKGPSAACLGIKIFWQPSASSPQTVQACTELVIQNTFPQPICSLDISSLANGGANADPPSQRSCTKHNAIRQGQVGHTTGCLSGPIESYSDCAASLKRTKSTFRIPRPEANCDELTHYPPFAKDMMTARIAAY